MTTLPPPPTGAPVIPPKAVPWLTALAGLVATGAATLPPHTIGFRICVGLSGFLALVGIVSPGLRHKPE